MSTIPPLSNSELGSFRFLLNAVKKNMGFIPNSITTMARLPAIMGSFSMLTGTILGDPDKVSPMVILRLMFKNAGWASKWMKKKDRVPLYLRQLVGHISSKAAGCQYCQAHTIGEAKHHGANERQLENIWNFETSDAFTDAERAALRFGLAAGSVPNSVTQEHFVELKKYWTDEQILEMGAVVSIFGFLNRWNDTFSTQLEKEPMEMAEKYLVDKGWAPGKHS